MINLSTVSHTFPSPFRKFDHENFLCTLLLPGDARRDAVAIRAFNVEIARIPGVVSDHKIALMRLKFWEDAIAKLFDKTQPKLPEHPVVSELAETMQRVKLTKRYFNRLIEARKMQYLNFIAVKQLENYAEETVSCVNYLLLEANDCRNVDADHAASHLGKALGITNILRSIYTQHTRTQFLPIPQEILMKHGVSQERFYRNHDGDKGVEEVVFEVATLAHQHLEKSKKLMPKVPKDARLVFLSSVACKRFLERLRFANFNLVDKSLGVRDSMLPLALYWTKFKGL